MARQATIIGTATDYKGGTWDVRERRQTAHDFDIFIGWPRNESRGRGGRGVAIIITVELAKHLSQIRQRDINLPIGLTAVKHIRREIGASWSWDRWWADLSNDLLTMTLEAFCAKHGCSIGAASQRRACARSTILGI